MKNQARVSVFSILLVVAGVTFGRETRSLDFDWRFTLGDPAGAQQVEFDDADWRTLDVPHDWSIEGEYSSDNPTGAQGGYLPAGIGWYRRVIDVPAEWSGRQVAVLFDGVFSNSTVWLNGAEVGGRPFGYLSFESELTKAIRPGRNVLAVRVDNTLVPASRWYTGAGIYGHVWLTIAEPVRVATWGTFVRTPEVTRTEASVLVTTEVRNDRPHSAVARVQLTVLDPSGTTVAESERETAVPSMETKPGDQLLRVQRPRLWSPESPSLYTLVTRVFVGNELFDEVRTHFGIRTIEWDKDRGFLLNGQVVKLRGVALHHDGGPVGAAIPDALNTRRLQMMKDMGANAVRTAHNPRTPFFYDECDRLGLMVMDEIFDGWHKKAEHDYGAHHFETWWQRDVGDWVRRDRNHPAIVIYSIGNETGRVDIHGITPFIRTLDGTRPTTGGRMMEGVDVVGLNGEGEATTGLLRLRALYPDKPLVLTEEPHTYQTRGFYRVLSWWRNRGNERDEYPPYGTEEVFTTDGDRRYNSSYDNSVVRQTARGSWRRTSSTAWIAGEFRWTGFDYLGEAGYTSGGFPARSFNQGVVDLGGIPKDTYYFYQSVWTQVPMVHVLPHWTHPGLNGRVIPVVAYSNCEEVELFLNDRSLGIKTRRDWLDFVWNVPYEPGELRAVGYRDGQRKAEFYYRTAGSPQRLRLEADNNALATNKRDLSVMTFAITDQDGVVVPWAHDRVDFRIAGPVKLLGYENGDPLDVTAHRIGWRRAFYGFGRGFYQATDEEGPIEVTAAAILGEREFERSTTVAFDAQRLALRGTLAPTRFAIHYTTNGAEPTMESPQFNTPFQLTKDTTVRALVLRDGAPFMQLIAEFKRIVKMPWTNPRYEHSGVVIKPLAGPFDEVMVGFWRSKNGVVEFRSDGVLLRQDAGSLFRELGWWSYELSDEPSGGVGTGELRWVDGRVGRIRLITRDGDAFVFTEDGAGPDFYERVPELLEATHVRRPIDP